MLNAIAKLFTNTLDLTRLNLEDLGILAHRLDVQIDPLESEYYRLLNVRDEAVYAASAGTIIDQERDGWSRATRRCEVILSNLEVLKPQLEKVQARMKEIQDAQFWAAVRAQHRRAGLC